MRQESGAKGLVNGTSRAHAQLLRSKGLTPPLRDLQESRVMILGAGQSDNAPLLLACLLGVWRAGGTAIAHSSANSEWAVRTAVDKARVEVLVYPAGGFSGVDWLRQIKKCFSVAVPEGPTLFKPSTEMTPHLFLPPKDYSAPPPPPGSCAVPSEENVGEADWITPSRVALCIDAGEG